MNMSEFPFLYSAFLKIISNLKSYNHNRVRLYCKNGKKKDFLLQTFVITAYRLK